jgi:hypothetical protein
MNIGTSQPKGTLAFNVRRAAGPGLSWKLRNNLTLAFVQGWLAYHFARPLGKLFGFGTFISRLQVRLVRADGEVVNYGAVSYRMVTTAFITALATAMHTQASAGDFFYHGLGIGTTAAAITDTVIETELTTEYTGNVRATGTHTSAAGVYESVATITLDSGTPAVTCHGVMTQAATGGGTLLDKHVFAAVNMASGDSFVATYQLTFTAGG